MSKIRYAIWNPTSAEGMAWQATFADAMHEARAEARFQDSTIHVEQVSGSREHMAKEWIVYPSGIASELHR